MPRSQPSDTIINPIERVTAPTDWAAVSRRLSGRRPVSGIDPSSNAVYLCSGAEKQFFGGAFVVALVLYVAAILLFQVLKQPSSGVLALAAGSFAIMPIIFGYLALRASRCRLTVGLTWEYRGVFRTVRFSAAEIVNVDIHFPFILRAMSDTRLESNGRPCIRTQSRSIAMHRTLLERESRRWLWEELESLIPREKWSARLDETHQNIIEYYDSMRKTRPWLTSESLSGFGKGRV